MRVVAAYIDLNPVRAGLVTDPKVPLLRICPCLGGKCQVTPGLTSCLKSGNWSEAAAEYRMSLFVTAGSSGRSDKEALDRETILAELKRAGN